VITPFAEKIRSAHLPRLEAFTLDTLQVNVGKLCNQTCKHCHVDAGPHRTEIMTRETAEWVVQALERHPEIKNLDITGGAPELNANFRYLVKEGVRLGRHVMDRCNLTVFFQPGQEDLPEFLKDHRVEIIASLPYYLQDQVDRQRGQGVYDKSIDALRRLNELGYGQDGSALELHLVYNPVGAYLPPSQGSIEAEFKKELDKRYGIVFNHLYTITNMPINRFKSFLDASGNFSSYMQKLEDSFNPAAVAQVMCRSLISVGWEGTLYDCDFNQMLDLPVHADYPHHIREFDAFLLAKRRIVTGDHCYGCTAGAGSSCGGAVV
jgi:radical SAM/Cys-rich protein